MTLRIRVPAPSDPDVVPTLVFLQRAAFFAEHLAASWAKVEEAKHHWHRDGLANAMNRLQAAVAVFQPLKRHAIEMEGEARRLGVAEDFARIMLSVRAPDSFQ